MRQDGRRDYLNIEPVNVMIKLYVHQRINKSLQKPGVWGELGFVYLRSMLTFNDLTHFFYDSFGVFWIDI